jgi:predicted NUDIX family NTP pyrophosphohydrolase
MRSSAGLLLFRRRPAGLQVLIGHMGGPYWATKEDHSWSIPKGEYEPGEAAQQAAVREFTEELGALPPEGGFLDLGENRQRTGKMVRIWAREGDFDAAAAVSNDFEMEWPPRSGRMQSFPEIDRAGWFDVDTARTKLVPAQEVFLDRLVELVTERSA